MSVQACTVEVSRYRELIRLTFAKLFKWVRIANMLKNLSQKDSDCLDGSDEHNCTYCSTDPERQVEKILFCHTKR